MPNCDISTFSFSENCCLMDPTESAEEAMVNAGSRSMHTTERDASVRINQSAMELPIAPPPMMTTSAVEGEAVVVAVVNVEVH